MKTTLGLAAALLVGLSGALFLLADDDSPSSATPAFTVSAPPSRQPPPPVAEQRAPPADRLPGEEPTSIAGNVPPEALAQGLAQRVYDSFGSRLVDYLAKQGLARADAEAIVGDLMAKTVTCVLDALREQALEQRVDFDHVLNALDAQLYDSDGPLMTALLDMGAVDRRATPCSLTALAQAGIPPQVAYELFPQQR